MVEACGHFLLGFEVTCCGIYILMTSYVESAESRTHACSPASLRSCIVMSLLQDVLRHQTMDSIERRFDAAHPDSDNSDDELVNVVRRLGALYYALN